MHHSVVVRSQHNLPVWRLNYDTMTIKGSFNILSLDYWKTQYNWTQQSSTQRSSVCLSKSKMALPCAGRSRTLFDSLGTQCTAYNTDYSNLLENTNTNTNTDTTNFFITGQYTIAWPKMMTNKFPIFNSLPASSSSFRKNPPQVKHYHSTGRESTNLGSTDAASAPTSVDQNQMKSNERSVINPSTISHWMPPKHTTTGCSDLTLPRLLDFQLEQPQ